MRYVREKLIKGKRVSLSVLLMVDKVAMSKHLKERLQSPKIAKWQLVDKKYTSNNLMSGPQQLSHRHYCQADKIKL